MDLLDLWRGTLTPRTALNLIARLPRHSQFMAALADDDDLADELLKHEQENGDSASAPALSEWSAEVERLTLIADRIDELIRTVAAANSKKAPPPHKPLPRPVTAYARAQRRRRQAKSDLIRQRLAEAAASGAPTMADVQADNAHTAPAGALKRGR